MKTYPSKRGLELLIPLAVVLGGVGLGLLWMHNWPGVASIGLITLFIGHLLLTTRYQIDGSKLTIKSGFIVNQTLDISTIRRVTATRNPLSSPAASIDRLEVVYNTYDSVLISPKDKTGFVNQLLAINPAIVVIISPAGNP